MTSYVGSIKNFATNAASNVSWGVAQIAANLDAVADVAHLAMVAAGSRFAKLDNGLGSALDVWGMTRLVRSSHDVWNADKCQVKTVKVGGAVRTTVDLDLNEEPTDSLKYKADVCSVVGGVASLVNFLGKTGFHTLSDAFTVRASVGKVGVVLDLTKISLVAFAVGAGLKAALAWRQFNNLQYQPGLTRTPEESKLLTQNILDLAAHVSTVAVCALSFKGVGRPTIAVATVLNAGLSLASFLHEKNIKAA